MLNNCRRAQGAEYRHGSRRSCLKGTRETVLNEIEAWAKDFKQSPVFWLNGLAGTGKSTIAQTVSERIFADGQLGASFFCSRDFEDRSDLHFIFPTLAFQLAHKFPKFRSVLVPLLQSDPDVAHESLYRQMEKLIIEPLELADISTVIVIDALDECKDEEPSSAILSVLGRLVERIPEVKFFITGRPEPRIRTGFRLPILVDSASVFVLHDVDPPLINSDIRLFLKHELSELAHRHQLGRWPSDEQIDLLCNRAAGLFVYAVATVKFLDSNVYLPERRLGAIVKLPECTAPEGKTRFNPKTTLDSLYTSILQTAFSEGDPEMYSGVRSVIGAVVLLVNPLPPSAIATLVSLDPREIVLVLTPVQSLLTLGEDSTQPVKPFHKSFPDFITDSSRCTDTRFYISPRNLHFELATNCLRMMNDGLEQNLLSLPDYALNSEVEDLKTRISNCINIALLYACRSWHNHLIKTEGDVSGVLSHLRVFLEEKFLAWLEVFSAVGAVGGAVVALESLMSWLREVCFWLSLYHHPVITYNDQVAKSEQLLAIAKDYFQFVTNFFEVINVSATHIYHSALELCPTSSIIRKLYYHRRVTCLPRVVIGTPESWAQNIAISRKEEYDRSCIWSLCGQFVAAPTRRNVEIRSQLTLELITILQPPKMIPDLTGPLAYSPDGRSIACASDTAIIIWDIQTGGVAKEIRCSAKNILLVWSLNGGSICTIDSEYLGTFAVHIYCVSSGMASSPGTLRSKLYPHLWTVDESFRVMTTVWNGCYIKTIDIFEVGSTLTKIQSFSPCPSRAITSVSFSPTTHHISFLDSNKLSISDFRSSEVLLRPEGDFASQCFSSDGSLFSASQREIVCVWKYDSGHYTLCGRLQFQGLRNPSLQFSPTPSSSILGHSKNILRVLRLHELTTSPETHRRQYVRLSRSGTRVATAHMMESTITTTDILAQTPPQFIDTDVAIENLFLTDNVLLVGGSGQVVAWLLTEEGLVDGVIGDRRVGRGDSIWTVLGDFGRQVWVEGQIGVIKVGHGSMYEPRVYRTDTGEVLHPTQAPPGVQGGPSELSLSRSHLYFHDLSRYDNPFKDWWQTSRATVQEGWVKDAKGKHQLWIPVEWRTDWDTRDWLYDVAIQFSYLGGRPVLVKF